MTGNSDDLIRSLLRSDANIQSGFRLLVNEYSQQLYLLIRRLVITHEDANDILQNTFIKAFKNINSFRGESSLKTWLCKIAVNESLTFLKIKRKRTFVFFGSIESKMANSLKTDEYFRADEISLKLNQAILKLPEKQRLVFNLRYYDELPFEEISVLLNTSTGALKANYHIAFKKIEKFLLTH